MVKIVLVSTSAPMLKDHPTGVWMEEVATPYYIFKEQGYEVVLASPKGGPIPIDQQSVSGDFFTDEAKKFLQDGDAIGMLSHSTKLEDVDFEKGDIDVIYVAGGHGACADLADNAILRKAIETLYKNDKIVAADCHGPVCLVDCCKPDGSPLIADKIVTAFTNSEEDAVQLSELVPFLLEDAFKEKGAKYEKGDDWASKVCVDGKLITGQNPQSSAECAQAVVKVLA